MEFSHEDLGGQSFAIEGCTCCWLCFDFGKFEMLDQHGCTCANAFCPVCRKCDKHCSCSEAIKEFHKMACGLRDVAVQAARANWADSLSSRMLRAAVGAGQKKKKAQVILYLLEGDRADIRVRLSIRPPDREIPPSCGQ